MTLEQLATRTRRLARTDTSGASDPVLIQMFEDAVRIFSKDVHGFHKEEYQKVSATFDTTTDYALNITITGGTNALAATDIVITSTDREDATGATIASDLQTALLAAIAGGDLTVTFTNFYFYISTQASSASTAITIASPDSEDYLDAQELLGLSGSLDEDDTTGQFNGDFPYGCTRRVTLDRRPISILSVMWDDYQLTPAPRSYFERDEYAGDPVYYYNEGKDLLLTPAPNEQKELYISYKVQAELDTYQGYQDCGLSSLTYDTDTGLTAATDYYFKVNIDGEGQTEYSITPVSGAEDYNAVITLMNAEVTGASFSITGGDLRCTSDEFGSDSSINLAAGTTGTDLFGTLTGFSAFDTAVDGTSALPDEIDEKYHIAIAYWAASELLHETFEEEIARQRKGEYYNYVRDYLVEYGNRNTSFAPKEAERLWWRYGG